MPPRWCNSYFKRFKDIKISLNSMSAMVSLQLKDPWPDKGAHEESYHQGTQSASRSSITCALLWRTGTVQSPTPFHTSWDVFSVCSQLHRCTDVRVLAKQFWIDGKFHAQFWHLVPLTCSNIPKFLSLLPTCVVLRVQRYDLECWACVETIRRENKTGVHTVMRFKLLICCLVIKFMALSPIWFQDWIIWKLPPSGLLIHLTIMKINTPIIPGIQDKAH